MTRVPEVLYLDNHLLILGKPAGMLSQSDATGDPDLITWSKHFLKEKFNKPGNVFAGLLHRIDRPVSGVLVIARTSKAAARLTSQFKARTTVKRYLALVRGSIQGQGTLTHWIHKSEGQARIVAESHPRGKLAILEYRVLERSHGLSLVDVHLKTGRPHQIRLQFSHIGHRIIGDIRYGEKHPWEDGQLGLHAWSLSFEHPVQKKNIQVNWSAPLLSWLSTFPELEDCSPLPINPPFAEVLWTKK